MTDAKSNNMDLKSSKYAAEKLDVCIAKIRELCKSGALDHYNYGTKKKPWYRFTDEQLEKFIKERFSVVA